MKMVGDVSAAVGKDFNELSTIYGKARTAGTLYAEDINQLTEAGIPIIEELSKVMGVQADEVKNLDSQGKLHFADLEKAFANMTGEGGRFNGMMDKMSTSTAGLLSTIEGNEMTYEQLNDILGWDNSKLNAAKAYAKSEVEKAVAAKDKEIERLKLRDKNAVKRERQLKQEIDHLERENKRLRDGISEILSVSNTTAVQKIGNKLLSPDNEPTEPDEDFALCCQECNEESLSFINEYANGLEYRCNSCGHVFMVSPPTEPPT